MKWGELNLTEKELIGVSMLKSEYHDQCYVCGNQTEYIDFCYEMRICSEECRQEMDERFM